LFFVFSLINPDKLISAYSQKAIRLLTAKENFHGLLIKKLSFSEASLHSLDTVVWHNVNAEVKLSSYNKTFSVNKISIHIDDLSVQLESIFKHKIRCVASGVTATASTIDQALSPGKEVRPESSAKVQQVYSLTDGKISFPLNVNFYNKDVAGQQLNDFMQDFKGLMVTGRCKYPLTFTAIVSFRIKGENVKSLLSVKPEGSYYTISINKESLRVVSWLFEEKLTNPEVELLAGNPFRIPRLLRIRDEAETVAKEAHAKNAFVPEDAYRHVLWSYLLTKEYGAKFAKKNNRCP